jgi:hypothetical protein
MTRRLPVPALLVLLVSCFVYPLAGQAATELDALRARIATLESELQRMKSMEREIAELKVLLTERVATAEDNDQKVKELEQEVSLAREEVADVRAGQDEWKTYDSVVHLSGYGSALYADSDATESFSRVLFAPIFHYQWRDLVLLESEFEVNVDEDGDSEFELEYLTIDLLLHDNLALGFGKFLSPVGQFRQNLHPTWINKLASAPVGFGHDQAAPISDVGGFARGGVALPFADDLFANYAVFVGNGPILELNEDGDEIEAIEAEGFTRDGDGTKVYGGRFGIVPFANSEVGFSFATGQAAVPGERSRDYDVWGADFVTHWRGFALRGEWVRSEIEGLDDASSPAPEGQVWEAWYTQLSYLFGPFPIETVVRYGDFDSEHSDQAQEQWAFGANWWFNTHTVAKFTYELNDGARGETVDDDRLLLELSYGF